MVVQGQMKGLRGSTYPIVVVAEVEGFAHTEVADFSEALSHEEDVSGGQVAMNEFAGL